jgi:hypothetical protein
MTHTRKPVEPWDTEKAAELAAEALRWLGPELPRVCRRRSPQRARGSGLRGRSGCR